MTESEARIKEAEMKFHKRIVHEQAGTFGAMYYSFQDNVFGVGWVE